MLDNQSSAVCEALIAQNILLSVHFGAPSASRDIFHYYGLMTQDVVLDAAVDIKMALETQHANAVDARRVFSVFIEIIQNAMYYAAELPEHANEKLAAIVVGKSEGRYYIVCANPIENQFVERVRSKIEPARAMSLEALKNAYRQQLQNKQWQEEDPISRGGGLGFLTIARNVTEPLDYAFIPAKEIGPDYTYFYITATLAASEA